jgi:hypothetical protein
MTTRVPFGWVAGAFAVLAVGAQAQVVSVEPGQQWKVDDETRYERLTTRTDSAASRPTTARTPITVRVMEARPDGYVVAWQYGPIDLSPPVSGATDPVEALKALMANVELVIEVNDKGQFGSLRNWQQVRDAALPLVDKMPLPANMPAAAQKEQSAMRSRVFSTKEGIENVLLGEVKLFFLFYGRRLAPDAAAKYDQIPNPLGGVPLPANLTIKLERADAQTATLRYTLALDPERSGKVIVETFSAMFSGMGKSVSPAEVDAVASSLNIGDTAVLVFDLATRWPQTLTYERRMEMMGRSRIDRVEYRRQP